MKRLKKILKWIAISAGVVIALLLMLNTYYVWSTGTRLEKRLAALRAQGEPVRIADLAHKPIPPETNAETFLRRADDDLDAIQKELNALYPKSGHPSGTLSPTDREKLEKLFAAYPNFMPLLERAAACPDYDPQYDFTPESTRFLKLLGDYRTLGRVLRAYSALRLSQDRPDDAIAAQLLMLRLTRAWQGDWGLMLMGYLTTLACKYVAMDGVNQVLRAGPVSRATRQTLDAELALHDDLDGLRSALKGERAFSLSRVREIPVLELWLTRGWSNDLSLTMLNLYDHHLANLSRSHAEAAAVKSIPSAQGFMPNPYLALVTLLEPPFATARQAAERNRAMARALRVLNALQARAGKNDQTPDISALGLPAEATTDPFNGEALHVKKLPEGWTVYSVGPDGVDDGGKLDGKSDFGFGPTGLIKGDNPVVN
jgi:hypothetical protein